MQLYALKIIDIGKIKWRYMSQASILHLSPPLLAKEMDLSPPLSGLFFGSSRITGKSGFDLQEEEIRVAITV
ncbi:hypothetical protein, partial [Duganella callida]|uniref:hypothetical protein n=1 Tax=Duganella callida TaxID=2561932 RepID=UPI00197A80B4